jgi:acetyl-CoA C-acetyltransferase
MDTREIVLCEAVRTPIGTYDGSLKSVSAADLGKIAIKAVLDRSKLDPAKVGNHPGDPPEGSSSLGRSGG